MRPIIDIFFIGEILFRRSSKENLADPFNISLADISINRQGNIANPLCEEGDVLYNLNPVISNFERYDEAIIPLRVTELDDTSRYVKCFTENDTNEDNSQTALICTMTLKHKPIPCNYAHTTFEFIFNDIIVTFDNYTSTLGGTRKPYRKLRTRFREEIKRMIIKEEVRINWPTY